MPKNIVSFSDLAAKRTSPYGVSLHPRMCASLDARSFSLCVEQCASWVEDAVHVVLRQFFAPRPEVSSYLLLNYPPHMDTVDDHGVRRERRTLLYRIRYLLRYLGIFASEWRRFEGWQVAGLRMSLDVFCAIVRQALPADADRRLEELVRRFELLWDPLSPVQDADGMSAELSALVDVAEEAFADLHFAFAAREAELARAARKAQAEASALATVRDMLAGVSSDTAETAHAVRRIESRQCRRAGVSAPVPWTAQETCRKLWDECRLHPETLSADVAGRKVAKADAFEHLRRSGRLPPSVTTLVAFVRAIDLAQKRHRKSHETIRETKSPRETINSTVGETIKETMTPHETINETISETISETIKSMPGITRAELIARLGKSRATVARNIAILMSTGTIERRGSKKTGGYFTNEKA